jgi:hypothetical protein
MGNLGSFTARGISARAIDDYPSSSARMCLRTVIGAPADVAGNLVTAFEGSETHQRH